LPGRRDAAGGMCRLSEFPEHCLPPGSQPWRRALPPAARGGRRTRRGGRLRHLLSARFLRPLRAREVALAARPRGRAAEATRECFPQPLRRRQAPLHGNWIHPIVSHEGAKDRNASRYLLGLWPGGTLKLIATGTSKTLQVCRLVSDEVNSACMLVRTGSLRRRSWMCRCGQLGFVTTTGRRPRNAPH
jgi:hypothetical protein